MRSTRCTCCRATSFLSAPAGLGYTGANRHRMPQGGRRRLRSQGRPRAAGLCHPRGLGHPSAASSAVGAPERGVPAPGLGTVHEGDRGPASHFRQDHRDPSRAGDEAARDSRPGGSGPVRHPGRGCLARPLKADIRAAISQQIPDGVLRDSPPPRGSLSAAVAGSGSEIRLTRQALKEQFLKVVHSIQHFWLEIVQLSHP
jgi:hypothetical protein